MRRFLRFDRSSRFVAFGQPVERDPSAGRHACCVFVTPSNPLESAPLAVALSLALARLPNLSLVDCAFLADDFAAPQACATIEHARADIGVVALRSLGLRSCAWSAGQLVCARAATMRSLSVSLVPIGIVDRAALPVLPMLSELAFEGGHIEDVVSALRGMTHRCPALCRLVISATVAGAMPYEEIFDAFEPFRSQLRGLILHFHHSAAGATHIPNAADYPDDWPGPHRIAAPASTTSLRGCRTSSRY